MTSTTDKESPVPAVSVILPAHNAERYVRAAVRSILEQTHRDLELIVIDDGSTDGTVEQLDVFETDRRLRLVRQENRGMAGARNVGLAAARAEIVALMDADDVSWPQRIERQLSFLRGHPDVAVVGTGARLVGQDGRPFGVLRLALGHDELIERAWGGAHPPRPVMCDPTMMFRREACRDVGGWDEELVVGSDQELTLRIMERHRAANLPDVLFDYRVHSNQVTRKNPATRAVRLLATSEVAKAKHRKADIPEWCRDTTTRDQAEARGVDRRRLDRIALDSLLSARRHLSLQGRHREAAEAARRTLEYIERYDVEDPDRAFAMAEAAVAALGTRDLAWASVAVSRSLRTGPAYLGQALLAETRRRLHKLKHRRLLNERVGAFSAN